MRFVAALPGLLLVALIFVGIRAGMFTAVESAAIAVLYALLVTSRAVSQARRWREFLETCAGAARTTGLILFVIALRPHRSAGCSRTCRCRPRRSKSLTALSPTTST